MTVGLLVYGLIQVTRTVAQARELQPSLNAAFDSLDLGAYTNTAAADVGGILLGVSHVACLVLAIGFSVPRIRTARRAAWIPVVCAAMALLATAAIVVGLLGSDPAWLARVHVRG